VRTLLKYAKMWQYVAIVYSHETDMPN